MAKWFRLSFIVPLTGAVAVAGAGISAVTFAPATSGAPLAGAPYNPVAGNQGFNVFVAGNATLNSTSVGGPVALGGNLTLGSGSFNLASQTPGTFTAPGDGRPTGLLVNGNVNWAASDSDGTVNVLSSDYVKVGDMTGSAVTQSGSAPTRVARSGQGSSSLPQIADVATQPTASVNQSGLVRFASAFSTFRAQSSNLGNCTGNVVLMNHSGTPLPATLPSNTSAYVTLTSGVQNVLNITAANLANISTLQFHNSPGASTPLIINVDTTGVGHSFTWSAPNFNGLQSANAAYILWNFPTATALTLSGSSTIPGTIYAPASTVVETDGNGINGGIIAAAYTQGGPNGSSAGGQVLPDLFATTVQSCGTAALTIALTADVGSVPPGGTVEYTITVANTGSLAYTGAALTAGLGGILDDASYNGRAFATVGAVTYTSQNLTWTGDLAAGGVAKITYSATVKHPDPGDALLSTTVTSTTSGNNCPTGSTDARCSVTVTVSGLTISTTANTSSAAPGAVVRYTIKVTNTGQTPDTGAAVTDPLAGVLDDATYNHDAGISPTGTGVLSYSSQILSWTGNLAVAATVTISYSVTVSKPGSGDGVLTDTVTSRTPGSNCGAGSTGPRSTDPRCTATVTVAGLATTNTGGGATALTITKAASAATAVPGATITYTITVTNTGQTPYTGAGVTDSLAGVLDDATYDHDAATVPAATGTLAYASQALSWTGNLTVAATVTITYSVTINNPDTGDHTLTSTVTSPATGSNCPTTSTTGTTNPRCTSTVTVLIPALTIATTAGASHVVAGQSVSYAIVIDNTGQVPYDAATISDPLSGVLGGAAYNAGATANTGTVSFSGSAITWTGDLPVDTSAVINYSVTAKSSDTDGTTLTNTVSTTAPGSNCGPGSTDPACTATVPVRAQAIALNDLTGSFALSGPPDTVAAQNGAVTMTVTTNSPAGYQVTVQAAAPDLTSAGSTDTISMGDVDVRGTGQARYQSLAAPVLVHQQSGPSALGGDLVSIDYAMDVPFVAPGTYTGTLDYIVATNPWLGASTLSRSDLRSPRRGRGRASRGGGSRIAPASPWGRERSRQTALRALPQWRPDVPRSRRYHR